MSVIDSPTSALVRLALDATSLRHMALANNIANASSPGYAPQRVNFEQQLGLARQALAGGGRAELPDLAGVKAFVEEGAPRAAGSPAATLDMEMVRMAQNTLQYQALLRASSRLGTIMATAINEGKK